MSRVHQKLYQDEGLESIYEGFHKVHDLVKNFNLEKNSSKVGVFKIIWVNEYGFHYKDLIDVEDYLGFKIDVTKQVKGPMEINELKLSKRFSPLLYDLADSSTGKMFIDQKHSILKVLFYTQVLSKILDNHCIKQFFGEYINYNHFNIDKSEENTFYLDIEYYDNYFVIVCKYNSDNLEQIYENMKDKDCNTVYFHIKDMPFLKDGKLQKKVTKEIDGVQYDYEDVLEILEDDESIKKVEELNNNVKDDFQKYLNNMKNKIDENNEIKNVDDDYFKPIKEYLKNLKSVVSYFPCDKGLGLSTKYQAMEDLMVISLYEKVTYLLNNEEIVFSPGNLYNDLQDFLKFITNNSEEYAKKDTKKMDIEFIKELKKKLEYFTKYSVKIYEEMELRTDAIKGGKDERTDFEKMSNNKIKKIRIYENKSSTNFEEYDSPFAFVYTPYNGIYEKDFINKKKYEIKSLCIKGKGKFHNNPFNNLIMDILANQSNLMKEIILEDKKKAIETNNNRYKHNPDLIKKWKLIEQEKAYRQFEYWGLEGGNRSLNSDVFYKMKYLKYKNKYLNLKNKI